MKIERRRYLLVEFMNIPPDIVQINKDLRIIVSKLVGEFGLAKSGLHVMDITNNFVIVRCNHHSRDIIESAIQLLNYENNTQAVRTVSGTLKKISKIVAKKLEDEK